MFELSCIIQLIFVNVQIMFQECQIHVFIYKYIYFLQIKKIWKSLLKNAIKLFTAHSNNARLKGGGGMPMCHQISHEGCKTSWANFLWFLYTLFAHFDLVWKTNVQFERKKMPLNAYPSILIGNFMIIGLIKPF